MRRFISLLMITTMVFTFAFSTAYADSDENHNKNHNENYDEDRDGNHDEDRDEDHNKNHSTETAYKNKIKQLKEDLKKYRKDEAKKAEILKEIATEKKNHKDNSFIILVNGNEVTTSTQPEIRDGKLLLPVRPIIKALGAKLEWNPSKKTIIITKGDIKITLTVGSDVAIVNNVKTTLEYKVVIKHGGTMIPIGVIAGILKQKYDFDNDSRVVIIDDGDGSNQVDDNYNTTGNIALNKTATASSVYPGNGTTTFAASNAFDGKKSTLWSSQFSDPQWISVDLGAQRYIGKVKLYWAAAYAKAYSIQLSNDGINWIDVYTTYYGDGAIDEITLPSLPARYVRIMGLQRVSAAYSYSLNEVEVFEGVVPTGTLTVSPSAIYGAVNLTTEGTSDWANWGYNTASDFNRKATVSPKINNYIKVGTVDPVLTTGNPVMYSWTDGTPVTAVTNSITVPYISGAGNGFQFVVPADTTAKVLQVYVSALSAKGKLEVSLSDGSAVAYTGYVDSPNVVTSKMFTINYKALTSGQALIIKYTVDTMYNSGSGGVSLQAAALK